MISVNKAINRGHLVITVPVFIIMFGVMGMFFYLGLNGDIPGYCILFGFLAGPLIAWIYWSFAVPNWRIWAYSNVEDVDELKSEAVIGQLIWPEGSFFEKTEIRTRRQRNLIKELETRYLDPKKRKKFVDDLTVPPKTILGFSRLSLLDDLIIVALGIPTGIYLLFTDNMIGGSLLSLTGLYFGFRIFRKLAKSVPPMILNIEGIEIAGDKYSWSEIQAAKANVEINGESSDTNLTLETESDTITYNIDAYNINYRKLNYLIHIYRGRFEKIGGP